MTKPVPTVGISVPYVYEVMGRRGKVGRTVHYSGTVDHSAPSVPSSGAPVVAEWSVEGVRGGSERFQCRSFGGRHYVRTRHPLTEQALTVANFGGAKRSAREADEIARLLKMHPGRKDTAVLVRLLMGEVPSEGNYGKPVDRVVTSDETFRDNDAALLARSLLFVDGIAWTRCEEPKLKVSYSKSNNLSASIEVVTEYDNAMERKGYGAFPTSRDSVDSFFNMGEYDEARDSLEGVYGRRTRGVLKSEVLDGEMFAFDGDECRFRALSVDLCRILQPKVGGMDNAPARQWMTLREQSNTVDFDIPLVADLLEDLLPHVTDQAVHDDLTARFETALHLRRRPSPPTRANGSALAP